MKPCQRCGGAKPGGQGRRFCDPCQEAHQSEADDRQKAANVLRTKRQQAKRGATGTGRTYRNRNAPEGTAWCSRCQGYQPVADFPPSKSRKSGVGPYCRPCYSTFLHARRLKTEFDMTPEEYQGLLDRQDGRCAICMAVPRTRRLAVDHDHKTGEVRGLLCTRCNHKVLGAARENPNILRRAAEYLERTLLRPVEEQPATKFEQAVYDFIDSHGATFAGIEMACKARFNGTDFERWSGDLERQAILTGRYRWALVTRHRKRAVRDAYVTMPLWLFASLLADDPPAEIRRCADGSRVHDFKGGSFCPACGLPGIKVS